MKKKTKNNFDPYNVQVHLKKIKYRQKVTFSCNLFQKVKISDILDSLHVK